MTYEDGYREALADVFNLIRVCRAYQNEEKSGQWLSGGETNIHGVAAVEQLVEHYFPELKEQSAPWHQRNPILPDLALFANTRYYELPDRYIMKG